MVNDEKLIAALLENTTVRAAAKAAGVSESTMFKRLTDEQFVHAVHEQRHYLLLEAANNVQRRISEAVDVIAEIMHDEEAPPQIRLSAAESVIKNAFEISHKFACSENNLKPSITDMIEQELIQKRY